MNCTKGKWKVEGDFIVDEKGQSICKLAIITARDANAHLIVIALNACASVNPDNPMAVAESIKDMYEALQKLVQVCRDVSYTHSELNRARQALAKAEGK